MLTKPPLSNKELISALNQCKDKEVVIPVETNHVTIGGSPCVSVVDTHVGFDWDDGFIYLTPQFPVMIVGEKLKREQKQFRQNAETLAWIRNILKRDICSNDVKISQIRRLLEK